MHVQPSDALPKIMLARYYGANLGRFLSVDPASGSITRRIPQTWNRYSYVVNNPLLFIDPNGEELALAVGGPTENNGFGHVALIHNDTVYSAGSRWSGGSDWGVSTTAYFGTANPDSGLTQDQSRQTTILVLDVTPEQEAAVVDALGKGPGKYNDLANNCADACENALEAGGVLPVTTTLVESGTMSWVHRTDPEATTPEDVQDQVEDQGLVREESTRGTAPANPKSKAATVAGGLKDKSGS